MLSIFSGYLSWDSSKGGSYFIKTIIEIFQRPEAKHTSVLVLCTKIMNQIAYEFESNVKFQEECEKKQMPYFSTTFTKDLILAPK